MLPHLTRIIQYIHVCVMCFVVKIIIALVLLAVTVYLFLTDIWGLFIGMSLVYIVSFPISFYVFQVRLWWRVSLYIFYLLNSFEGPLPWSFIFSKSFFMLFLMQHLVAKAKKGKWFHRAFALIATARVCEWMRIIYDSVKASAKLQVCGFAAATVASSNIHIQTHFRSFSLSLCFIRPRFSFAVIFVLVALLDYAALNK